MASRYSRQIRLKELGQAGQSKLQSATVRVRGSGFEAQVEEDYLFRAGIGRVLRERARPEAFAHSPFFAFKCSQEVGAGAWRALHAIRKLLEID